MATDLRAFAEELVALPKAIWADCKPGGIWYAERISMEPFQNLTLPFSVVQIGSLTRSPEYTASGLIFEAEVAFWRVADTGADGSGLAMLDSLNDLVNALWPGNALTAGQVLEVRTVSYADDLLPNQAFRAANHVHRAGMVGVRVLTGDTG